MRSRLICVTLCAIRSILKTCVSGQAYPARLFLLYEYGGPVIIFVY